jgi:hypothetical protein
MTTIDAPMHCKASVYVRIESCFAVEKNKGRKYLLAIVKKTNRGNSKSISSRSFLNLFLGINESETLRLSWMAYRLMISAESVAAKKAIGALLMLMLVSGACLPLDEWIPDNCSDQFSVQSNHCLCCNSMDHDPISTP